MSDHKCATNSKRAVQTSMFGPAPVLKGEDSKAYGELLMQVSSYVKPADIVEDFWVRDVVDHTWNILRYRRNKKGLLEAAKPKALEEILTPFMDDPSRFGAMRRYNIDGHQEPTPAMELVNKWIRRNPKALKEVDEILASGNLTMQDVEARAFAIEIDKIQQIDHLTANAEARRNAVLREIDHRRAGFAAALRHTTQNVVEGEFEPVNQKAIAQKATNQHSNNGNV